MSSPATMPLPLIHARSVANTAMIATPIVNSIVRGRSRHSRRGGVREFIEITRLLLYGRNPDRIKRIELLLRGVPARRFGDRLARNRGGLGHHVNARSKCGPDGFSFPLVRLTTTYLLWIIERSPRREDGGAFRCGKLLIMLIVPAAGRFSTPRAKQTSCRPVRRRWPGQPDCQSVTQLMVGTKQMIFPPSSSSSPPRRRREGGSPRVGAGFPGCPLSRA